MRDTSDRLQLEIETEEDDLGYDARVGIVVILYYCFDDTSF